MSSERPEQPARDAPDDAELEDFLAGRSPISAAYREASRGDHVPPELDAAVMAAARAAPVAPAGVRRPRWLPFAAAAASLVLGVSVLVEVGRAPEAQLAVTTTASSEGMARALASGTAQAPQSNEIEHSPRAAPDDAAAKVERIAAHAAAERTAAESKALAEARERQRVNGPEPEARRLAREGTESSRSAAGQDRVVPGFAAPSAAPQEQPAKRKAAPAAAEASADEPSGQLTTDARAERSGHVEAQAASPPPAPPPVRREADEAPEPWLARIRELAKRDDLETVQKELRRFVERYPDHALPPDLRELAGRASTPAAEKD